MRSPRSWIVFLGCLAIGGTFVVAGALKSLDVDGFARDIALHGIIGPGPSRLLARLLVPFEIAAGAAVIIGYRRRLGLALLIAALGVFAGATAWAWAHGNTEGCGCFGRFASRTPLSVIVEDLILIGAGGAALVLVPRSSESSTSRPGGSGARGAQVAQVGETAAPAPGGAPDRSHPRPRWKPALVGLLALASFGFTLASPHLPIDNLATALRPGVELRDLGLDRIAGRLAEGDRLLVILAIDEEPSRQAIAGVNALLGAPGAPPITGLTSASEEDRAELFWTYAPSFEFVEVPAADLRRLYRRAPRSFAVHNGRVLRVWSGVPPAEELGS